MPFLNKWFKVSLPAITATGATLTTVLLVTLKQEDNSNLLNIQDEELKDLELKSESFKDQAVKAEKQKEVESLEELTKKLNDVQQIVDALADAKGDSLEAGNSGEGKINLGNRDSLSNSPVKETIQKSLEDSTKSSFSVVQEGREISSQNNLTQTNERDGASKNSEESKKVSESVSIEKNASDNLNTKVASSVENENKNLEQSQISSQESQSEETAQIQTKGSSDSMGGGAGSNVGTAPEGKGKWTDKELKDLTEILENSFDISLQLQVVTER